MNDTDSKGKSHCLLLIKKLTNVRDKGYEILKKYLIYSRILKIVGALMITMVVINVTLDNLLYVNIFFLICLCFLHHLIINVDKYNSMLERELISADRQIHDAISEISISGFFIQLSIDEIESYLKYPISIHSLIYWETFYFKVIFLIFWLVIFWLFFIF